MKVGRLCKYVEFYKLYKKCTILWRLRATTVAVETQQCILCVMSTSLLNT
jgi:hypothetical protein